MHAYVRSIKIVHRSPFRAILPLSLTPSPVCLGFGTAAIEKRATNHHATEKKRRPKKKIGLATFITSPPRKKKARTLLSPVYGTLYHRRGGNEGR